MIFISLAHVYTMSVIPPIFWAQYCIVKSTCSILSQLVGWLVGWFGLNGPLRQYFSLYWAVSQREGERVEK